MRALYNMLHIHTVLQAYLRKALLHTKVAPPLMGPLSARLTAT